MTVLGLAVVIYIFTDVMSNIRLKGSFNYLMAVFYGVPQENYYRSIIMYIPLMIGMGVGLSQYVPEVLSKRIKLTLHLPMKGSAIIYNMILFGFGLVLLIYAAIFGTFFIMNNHCFPFEESWSVLISLTPWMLGGIAAYFMIAMISMEPNMLYQIFYVLVGYFLVVQFYIGTGHGDTRYIIPQLALMAIIPCVGLLYTSNRFIKGER